ncbi:P-loop containing nucleoside triphosphate hydrolase protein [Mycena albidolilacea]|uniref:P-loop containing nucleoside triphosphate hydrolase protein n=1 Tax=Mycena albidolilacea TaxID=1033008 RepID=A0AAD7F570_9AGAR|nr:P-loop containing nucleoside triphosphate hydrolase protein [Mycena albidolilacea]
MNTTATNLLGPTVPQRRALWDDIKGIPGSMQLVSLPGLRSSWVYGYVVDGIKYLAAGAVVDAVRRVFLWLYQRVKLRYSTSAEFVLGDPSYEWIVLFLTENNVWQHSRDFKVTSKSSKLVYGVSVSADPEILGSADYVPTYESPQLFRWRGYWVEVQRYRAQVQGTGGQPQQTAAIFLTVFTRNLSVLSELVEEAHRGYQNKIKPFVTIFLADSPSYGGSFLWNVKRKPHRPIESIILPEGTLDDLISDAKRFFASESWYHRAGIPHRRGYLLYGPPGTGKSSTIHAVAGILNLEIHSFSLASAFVDDSFLQRATSTIPKRSIVLVEDIDCALPSREDDDDSDGGSPVRHDRPRRSGVTLSGLLNMIDGIGSEEGKLFFATTNYIDRLDSALMRPGRIDRRIRYTLATVAQAQRLYERLFKDAEVDGETQRGVRDDVASPLVAATPLAADLDKPGTSGLSAPLDISPDRAETRVFAAAVRDYEFSPAELQGYLLSNRESPIAAAADMSAWVARQRSERQEKADLKAQRKERMRAARAKMEAARFHPHQYGPYTPFPPPPPHMGLPPPPGVLPSPLPSSPTPSLPLGQSGDTDVAAVAPDAPLAASTTPAPASPPLVPHATTPPPSHLDNPEPSIPKLVNGINGTS